MNGLELAKAYYAECGKPMLESEFADCLPLLAVGLCGSGSECFGFDDEISRDHDFEPGFCIFLPDEETLDRRTAFRLERAYDKLPREFHGIRRSLVDPVGGRRHGVLRSADFFKEKTGSEDGNLSAAQWLTLPSHYLAEATNGEIFYDGDGAVTAIRQRLAEYPENVRRKKIAGHLLCMAQAGNYNYGRCLQHGETGAAQLAAIRFAESAMQTVFLLNRSYMPFYKWSFRAMRTLPLLASLADALEYLIGSENDAQTAGVKQDVIADVIAMILEECKRQAVTTATCGNPETHAYAVNDTITDSSIRNLNIFAGV